MGQRELHCGSSGGGYFVLLFFIKFICFIFYSDAQHFCQRLKISDMIVSARRIPLNEDQNI